MEYKLENSDSSIRNIETEAEHIQNMLEQVNESMENIAQTIARLEKIDDWETANALQVNLNRKQEEHVEIQREISRINEKLSNVEKSIAAVKAENAESEKEIDALKGVDEDVGNASTIIEERKKIVKLQEEQCRILREKIGNVVTGDTSQYEPRSKASVSEQIKWVDEGIRQVAVNGFERPEGITGQGDFKKISMDEMRSGILRLQDMWPTIENGVGDNSDYWANYDKKHNLAYNNGYQRVFDAFFGMDAIKVTFDGERYDIVNGRHRIWLAKNMGIDYLPMRLTRKSTK